MTISIKSDAEHRRHARRGPARLGGARLLTPHVKPGVTTDAIDKLAHDYIVNEQGGVPAPLNYAPPGYTPYPKSICTSINHVVCHGIPNDRPLKNGDIVNIDVTVIKDGWHGDTSRMFIVGEGSIAARRLVQITYDAMWHGIVKVKPGARLGDIGHAIQIFTESARLLGRARVLRPRHRRALPRGAAGAALRQPGHARRAEAGHDFTIEPMINAGKRDIREAGDGWTIVTRDRSLSAQWEHTVLVTETGYEVLTLSAGSAAAAGLRRRLKPRRGVHTRDPIARGRGGPQGRRRRAQRRSRAARRCRASCARASATAKAARLARFRRRGRRRAPRSASSTPSPPTST